MTSLHPPSIALRRRLAWGLLLLALVLGPALGRMHQIVHGPGAAGQAGHATHGAARQALETLHGLFAGHGHADCQVLDQQNSLGGAGQVPTLALAQALPQGLPAGRPEAAPATRRPSPFHARAPPARA